MFKFLWFINTSPWEFLSIFCPCKILDFQTARSDLLLTYEHFSTISDHRLIPVILIFLSCASIILDLIIFLFNHVFSFVFCLFSTFWEIFYVCFLHYQFSILVSILFPERIFNSYILVLLQFLLKFVPYFNHLPISFL